MTRATKIKVVPPEVCYAEKLTKRLADFYEVPCPRVVTHPRYPVRLRYLAQFQARPYPTIHLAHPHDLVTTIGHEFQHYLDDLMGYNEHHIHHSPGFYRRVAVTLEEARAAWALEQPA